MTCLRACAGWTGSSNGIAHRFGVGPLGRMGARKVHVSDDFRHRSQGDSPSHYDEDEPGCAGERGGRVVGPETHLDLARATRVASSPRWHGRLRGGRAHRGGDGIGGLGCLVGCDQVYG